VRKRGGVCVGGAFGGERERARNVRGEESALTTERARARTHMFFWVCVCV